MFAFMMLVPVGHAVSDETGRYKAHVYVLTDKRIVEDFTVHQTDDGVTKAACERHLRSWMKRIGADVEALVSELRSDGVRAVMKAECVPE